MTYQRDFNAEIPDDLNMASYFLDVNVAEGRGDRVALYHEDKTYTYKEICSLTNQVGNVFKKLGVEMENRIYLVLNDSPELVAAFYGAIKIGAVATLAYSFLKAEDYEYEVNYVRPKILVTESSSLDRVREAIKHLRYPLKVLVVNNPEAILREGEQSFWELMNTADNNLDAALTHKLDPALWKFSGGTTGYRKAIPHCHADAVYAYESFQRIVQYRQDDIVLSIPKMFFGYGRDGTIVFPFRVGASAVLFPDRVTPQKVFDLVKKHKPTILVQVPTAIRQMLDAPKEERPDFSSVRLCTSAGEALPPELYHAWKKGFGCEIVDGIGSAEMYYVYVSNIPGDVVPGTLGKPAPGYEAKIVNDEGKELPDGEIGILIAKGESAGLEYYRDREKTRKTFRGEWVYTDDLFFKDKDGNFHFAGRRDDLLKVSGYFVSPLEIEQCIATHPDVAECAVIGIPDEHGLDKTKAFVVLKEGVAQSEEKAHQIQMFPKQKLSPYKYPRLIEFVDELPKTALGKLDRRKLKGLRE